MSGSSTTPILDVEDLLGRNQLGDTETDRLNQALNDLVQGLDEVDEPVDDLIAALEQAMAPRPRPPSRCCCRRTIPAWSASRRSSLTATR
jgi:hypothetical protein